MHSGYASTLNAPEIPISIFKEYLILVPQYSWCLQWVDMLEKGVAITRLSRIGQYNFSDGFIFIYGMAAWVIEGNDSIGQILGRAVNPGSAEDQFLYHNELAGIYHITATEEQTCNFFDIKEGTVACNVLSNLNKAFSYIQILNLEDPSYNFIEGIQCP